MTRSGLRSRCPPIAMVYGRASPRRFPSSLPGRTGTRGGRSHALGGGYGLLSPTAYTTPDVLKAIYVPACR